MQRSRLHVILALTMVLLACGALSAATVLQMNLQQMVDRADKIFRGTVMDVREGTVRAGGADLPTVTYRIRVDEAFKGSFEQVKGLQIAQVTMIGKLKPTAAGAVRHLSALPELPQLKSGENYLLLTTQPSTVGLSTTIGLGQGAFTVTGKPGQELAVNGNQNRGLFLGIAGPSSFAAPQAGPLPYAALADFIRNSVR
jgi:hypothetical protein